MSDLRRGNRLVVELGSRDRTVADVVRTNLSRGNSAAGPAHDEACSEYPDRQSRGASNLHVDPFFPSRMWWEAFPSSEPTLWVARRRSLLDRGSHRAADVCPPDPHDRRGYTPATERMLAA